VTAVAAPHPVLTAEALAEIYAHARREYPNECCGIAFGPRDRAIAARALACVNIQNELHAEDPVKHTRDARTAYNLGAGDLFKLQKSLRGDEPAKIVYHSHVDIDGDGCYFSATDQMAAQMDALAHQLEARLAELGTSEDLAARIHEKVTRALQKAEEKIARALSDAERRARHAEERATRMEERHRRRGPMGRPMGPMGPAPTPPQPPVPPRPKRAPVTDEERMQILRMVESGKLSIEQAEQLLKVLNG
jgi:adenylyltransferase/sulfurtransferase